MHFLQSLVKKKFNIKEQFPDLYRTYEVIVSNNPNFKEDYDRNLKDELFLSKHNFYSDNLNDPLKILFNTISFNKQSRKQTIMYLRQIEYKLKKKICAFAANRSLLINKIYPDILELEKKSLQLQQVSKQLRNLCVFQQREINKSNKDIEKQIRKKQNLILYLECLKKKNINSSYQEVQEVTDPQYLNFLRQNMKKLYKSEYLLSPEILSQKKIQNQNKLYFYYSHLTNNFSFSKFQRVVEFLKESEQCYGPVEKQLQKMTDFCLRMLVVRILRKSLFDDQFDCKTTNQIYLLCDFYKLQILLPTLPSNNLCSFLTDLLTSLTQLFNSIDLQLYSLYKFNKLKAEPFYDKVQRNLFLQKTQLSTKICDVLTQIFQSVNLSELTEITVNAFLSFILRYEDFLSNLKDFTSHLPSIPNQSVLSLVNEYICRYKEKSLRTIFHDNFDENWSILFVDSQLFKEKLLQYLNMEKDLLQISSLLSKDINTLQQKIKTDIYKFSFKKNKDFRKQQKDNKVNYSLPNSTPQRKTHKADKTICRSCVTVISIMTDYTKFCGLFTSHIETVLEDCSFLVNVWIFSIMSKFVPLQWMKQVLDFSKKKKIQSQKMSIVESQHDLFVFKFRFRELKRFFYNFNTQFIQQNKKLRQCFKGFMEKIINENQQESSKSLFLALKSIKYILNSFEMLDRNCSIYSSKELYDSIELFTVQYYFLERYKNHKAFEALLSFNFQTLQILIQKEQNKYLQSIFQLIDDLNIELQENAIKSLSMLQYEVQHIAAIIIDMILMVVSEIYAQNYRSGSMGKIQMKHDMSEILQKVQTMISSSQYQALDKKYSEFVEVYFYSSSKDIYKYIMQNFYRIPFALCKGFLLSSTKQEKFVKDQLVLTEEQKKILAYVQKKVSDKILQEEAEEDFIDQNILLDSITQEKLIENESVSVLYKFLKMQN